MSSTPDPSVSSNVSSLARPSVEDVSRWYALQVKPRHEKRVNAGLEELGQTVFLPQYSLRRRWSDRVKDVLLPLFPGYTFCRATQADHWRVLRVPGVTAIVGFGRDPAPLDEQEVEAIQSIVHSGLPVTPWPVLQRGDRVYLQGGPLQGLRGHFMSFRGSHRIVVSVALLQRAVAVEILQEWVVPEGRKGPASELQFYRNRLRVSASRDFADRRRPA